MRIKSVIFDFDGVINDSASIKGAGGRIIKIVKNNRIAIPDDIFLKLKKYWGVECVQLIKICFNVDENTAERLFKQWEKEDEIKVFPLVNGTKETLSNLTNENYVLSILTSRRRENLLKIMNKYKLAPFFLIIQSVSDWPYSKPDPRALDYILEITRKMFGFHKNNHLFVGDTPTDWECARDKNVEFLAVTSGVYSRNYFAEIGVPKKNIIPSIAHLPKWLKEHS